MSYNLEFKRKERKYLIIEHSFEEIKQALENYMPVHIFNGNNPVSFIQTTYFDSKNFLVFKEYINRRKFRFKIRIRRYCQEEYHKDDNLVELKIKHNSVSYKKRFHLPIDLLEPFLKGEDIINEIKYKNRYLSGAQKTYEIIRTLILINNFVPVLQTSFERVAFQKKKVRVRITVDRNIKHQKLLGYSKQDKLDALVLESKIKGKIPAWNKKMVNRLSLIRQKRFSKYATGINSIYFPERGKYNFDMDKKIIIEKIPDCINESLDLLSRTFKIDN